MSQPSESLPAIPPGWERVAPDVLIEHFNERAAVAEYEGGASRQRAEQQAAALMDQTYLVLRRVAVRPQPKKKERELATLERLGIFLT